MPSNKNSAVCGEEIDTHEGGNMEKTVNPIIIIVEDVGDDSEAVKNIVFDDGEGTKDGTCQNEPQTQDIDSTSNQDPVRAFGQERDAVDQWGNLSSRPYEPPGRVSGV